LLIEEEYMSLTSSPDQNAVTDDEAVRLLLQRAVLTTAVCRELVASNGDYAGRRPITMLGLLRSWIDEHYPHSAATRSAGGIDRMRVPEGSEGLLQEIRDGAEVCDALGMLWTADSRSDYERDMKRLDGLLGTWRAGRGETVEPRPESS
jgi:hypothetical protein